MEMLTWQPARCFLSYSCLRGDRQSSSFASQSLSSTSSIPSYPAHNYCCCQRNEQQLHLASRHAQGYPHQRRDRHHRHRVVVAFSSSFASSSSSSSSSSSFSSSSSSSLPSWRALTRAGGLHRGTRGRHAIARILSRQERIRSRENNGVSIGCRPLILRRRKEVIFHPEVGRGRGDRRDDGNEARLLFPWGSSSSSSSCRCSYSLPCCRCSCFTSPSFSYSSSSSSFSSTSSASTSSSTSSCSLSSRRCCSDKHWSVSWSGQRPTSSRFRPNPSVSAGSAKSDGRCAVHVDKYTNHAGGNIHGKISAKDRFLRTVIVAKSRLGGRLSVGGGGEWWGRGVGVGVGGGGWREGRRNAALLSLCKASSEPLNSFDSQLDDLFAVRWDSNVNGDDNGGENGNNEDDIGSNLNRGSYGDCGEEVREMEEEVGPASRKQMRDLTLPLTLSGRVIVTRLGEICSGKDADKYWHNRRGVARHPYPVGYSAIKWYKGRAFLQRISKGPNGPVFLVADKESGNEYAGDSPSQAWRVLLQQVFPKASGVVGVAVHGRKFFGLDDPIVLNALDAKMKLLANENQGVWCDGSRGAGDKFLLEAAGRGGKGEGDSVESSSPNPTVEAISIGRGWSGTDETLGGVLLSTETLDAKDTEGEGGPDRDIISGPYESAEGTDEEAMGATCHGDAALDSPEEEGILPFISDKSHKTTNGADLQMAGKGRDWEEKDYMLESKALYHETGLTAKGADNVQQRIDTVDADHPALTSELDEDLVEDANEDVDECGKVGGPDAKNVRVEAVVQELEGSSSSNLTPNLSPVPNELDVKSSMDVRGWGNMERSSVDHGTVDESMTGFPRPLVVEETKRKHSPSKLQTRSKTTAQPSGSVVGLIRLRSKAVGVVVLSGKGLGSGSTDSVGQQPSNTFLDERAVGKDVQSALMPHGDIMQGNQGSRPGNLRRLSSSDKDRILPYTFGEATDDGVFKKFRVSEMFEKLSTDLSSEGSVTRGNGERSIALSSANRGKRGKLMMSSLQGNMEIDDVNPRYNSSTDQIKWSPLLRQSFPHLRPDMLWLLNPETAASVSGSLIKEDNGRENWHGDDRRNEEWEMGGKRWPAVGVWAMADTKIVKKSGDPLPGRQEQEQQPEHWRQRSDMRESVMGEDEQGREEELEVGLRLHMRMPTSRIASWISERVRRKRNVNSVALFDQMVRLGMEVEDSVLSALFPFKLDIWQREAVQAVADGKSVFLCAPMGAGKNTVAQYLIHKTLAHGKRAVFLTPTNELAQQRFIQLQKIFGRDRVGAAWRYSAERPDARLTVTTAELMRKALYPCNHNGGPACLGLTVENIGLMILDEFHTLAERTRGSHWEEVVMLARPEIKLLALCRPALNAGYAASWMNHAHGPCKLVQCTSEPVPRKFHFCDPEAGGLQPLLNSNLTEMNPIFRSSVSKQAQRSLEQEPLKELSSNTVAGGDSLNQSSAKPSNSSLATDRSTLRNASILTVILQLQRRGMLPAIFFIFSRAGCDRALNKAVKAGLPALLTQKEKHLMRAKYEHFEVVNPGLADKIQVEALMLGFASHHAGVMPAWKTFIVDLINDGLIKLTFATEVLAMWSVSCRTVVFTTTLKKSDGGSRPLSGSEYQQLSGIAGRRGLDEFANVVFLKSAWGGAQEAVNLALHGNFRLCSRFKPSMALVLNILRSSSLTELRVLIGKSLLDYTARQQKEASLRVNPTDLAQASLLRRVVVNCRRHDNDGTSSTLGGVLLAKVPDDRQPHYVTLCEDNMFRLIPAGAIAHLCSVDEPSLEKIYKEKYNKELSVARLPPEGSWVSMGPKGYGFQAPGNEETEGIANMLRGIDSTNAAEDRGSESSDQSLATATEYSWREVEKLVRVLERAGALKRLPNDSNRVQLSTLGNTAALVHGENELWLASLLTSGVLRSLQPAELAVAMSALSLDENRVRGKTGKRETWRPSELSAPLTTSLRKMEELRTTVQELLRTEDVRLPVSLDFSPIHMVQAWVDGSSWNDLLLRTSLEAGETLKILQKTVQLLDQVSYSAPTLSRYKIIKTAPAAVALLKRYPVANE